MEKLTFPSDLGKIRICGRHIVKDNALWLSWSGSFLEIAFKGKSLSAHIKTDFWDCDRFYGRMAVIIDDCFDSPQCFMLENGTEKDYTLFSSDTERTVKIRLVKLSEAAYAKTAIMSLTVDGELLPPPAVQFDRRIEVIGDSITCGYGIEGVFEKDEFSTTMENPLKAYSIKLAQKCKAEYQLVSWSGIGTTSSYIDPDVDVPRNDWLMPPLYPYTDKGLENVIGFVDGKDYEEWDFSRFVPDVIVINLGTNDASWVRNIPERRTEYISTYVDFLKFIREKNPDSYIVCTYGIMGTDLSSAIDEVVSLMNDEKISYLPLEVQKEEDGIGADWHPSAVSHEKMAERLADYVNGIFAKIGK